jgi:hypothetical protein
MAGAHDPVADRQMLDRQGLQQRVVGTHEKSLLSIGM